MTAQITMYGADWCGDCRRSTAFLKSHNVEFNYIDIELDEAASDKVIENQQRIAFDPCDHVSRWNTYD